MRRVIVILCIIFFAGIAKAQVGGVRIGKESKEANPKAMLEVDSDSKGILIPRLTTRMRENMFSGKDNSAVSLLVYDLDLNKFMYWSGDIWKTIGEGGATAALKGATLKGTKLVLSDKDGDSLAEVELASLYSGVRSSATAPADGKLGDLYYNTDTKLLYLNDGYSWQALQNMAAKLDKNAIFDGDVKGTYDDLKIKDEVVTNKQIAPNTILGSNINQMSATAGDVLYWNGYGWIPTRLTVDGDVFGFYDEIKIKRNVVTNIEIAPNTILGTNINQMAATPGQVLQWNGYGWIPATVTSGGDGDSDPGNEIQTLSEVLDRGSSAGNKRIRDLAEPTSINDAATKRYVDEQVLSGGGTAVKVIDNLLSTDPNSALSANQGKELNRNKIGKTTNFGGEVSGTYDAIKIKENVITNIEIAAKTIMGTNLNSMGALAGQFLKWDGVSWTPSEATKSNLVFIASPTGGTLTNSNGNNAILTLANSANAGLMAPADKTKLDDDKDGSIENELQTLSEVLDRGASADNKKIIALGTPTNELDAANKQYVDAMVRMTGDITAVNAGTGLAGGGTENDVTLSLADIAANTVLANITAATATPTAVTYEQFKAALKLKKTDVGLDNVDNTSDKDKPLSDAVIAALAAKIDASKLAAKDGVATLDVNGRIPVSQLPALTSSTVNVLDNEADMLALSDVGVGSTVVRSDEHKTYILAATPASELGNWVELLTPTSSIESVNGQKGAVVLGKNDIGLGNVDNTSDLNKPVSTATQTELDLKEDKKNKSTDVLTDAGSDVKYPTVKAVKAYTDNKVASSAETAESIKTKLGITTISGENTGDQTDVPGTAENVRGVVDIAHGGTGQTTAAAAIKALLPAQVGNAGKVLKTDGTTISWVTPAPSVTDLEIVPSGDKIIINSSTGKGIEIPVVNTTNAGLMTPVDKAKLDADKDGDITNELQTLAEVLLKGASAGDKIITNLLNPVDDQDAATKIYVDNSKGDNPSGIINPSKGKEGDIFFNTTSKKVFVHDGTNWVEMITSVSHDASLVGKGNETEPLKIAKNAIGPNNLKGLSSSLDFGKSGSVLQSNGDGTFSWRDLSGGVAIDPSALSLTKDQFYIGNSESKAEAIAKSSIPISGFGIAMADVSLGDAIQKFKIINLSSPTDDNDAATKKYVDDKVATAGNISAINASGGIKGSATTGNVNLSLDDIAAKTVLANITAASTVPAAVTFSQFKTALNLRKTDIGLGNVDNTSDLNKPISTATQNALANKIDKSEKAAKNGVATLDASGKIPVTQIPSISSSTVDVLDNEAAMLALAKAVVGSTVVRTDENRTYILAATPASTLSNWVEIRTPTSSVASVNGKAGTVVIGKTDVGLGNVDNTSDLNKPISTAAQAALDLKEDKANKSIDVVADAGSSVKYPTVRAIKSYVDNVATVADASTTVKGKIQLAGDLIGTAGLPRVATVGGETATNISDGVKLANNATHLNTASTIVRRDGSGNFTAGTITAKSFMGDLVGDISGNAATVTTNANLSGDVTSVGNTTTLQNDAVTSSKIVDKTITTADLADQAVSAMKLKNITGNGLDGQILTSNGIGGFKWSDAGALPNLIYTPSATKGEIKLGSGLPAIIPAGSTAEASLMLPGDKTKLDKIDIPEVKAADANKVLTAQADGSTAWAEVAGGSTDMPSYTVADANKVLTVNAKGTGVVWAKAAGGGSSMFYHPNGDKKYFVKATGPGVVVSFDGKHKFTVTVPVGVDLHYIKIRSSYTELGSQNFMNIKIVDVAKRFNNSLDDVFMPDINLADIMTTPITLHTIQGPATTKLPMGISDLSDGAITLECNMMGNFNGVEGFFITLRF